MIMPRLKDQRGQMSIFIALIFQVLFVLFAMIINIGLVVHDKINLQNAVDLGAYYAAERQSEILNEIAHINYQIRQDYKLLAWRYFVLGTIGGNGFGKGIYPPGHPSSTAPMTDVFNYLSPNHQPSMCVVNEFWSDIQDDGPAPIENHCAMQFGTVLPRIEPQPVIAPWVPFAGETYAATVIALNQLQTNCAAMATKDWYFAAEALYLYKSSVAVKKEMIYELRRRLIVDGDSMLDQNMQSIRTGVLKTIRKNLTLRNAARLQDSDVQVLNGLSLGPCGQNEGELILPEVRIWPMLYYTHAASSCDGTHAVRVDVPELSHDDFDAIDPDQFFRSRVLPETEDPSPEAKLMHSSLGFEKNPWCMAYVGVKANLNTQKPFMPLASALLLQARAFAQPFGGRIGPWYHALWPRSSPFSAGGGRTDPLTAPRVLPGGTIDTQDSAEDPTTSYFWMTPNYSRYPGDPFGLKSNLAMAAQRPAFQNILAVPKTARLRLTFWNGAVTGIGNIETGDPLSWDPADSDGVTNTAVGFIRAAEVAAVAPDVFDAMYYSVEPAYYANYQNHAAIQFPTLPQIFGHVPTVPLDIGGRNVASLNRFQVENQINQVKDLNGGSTGALYWVIRDPAHLLTGWAPSGVQNFAFPTGKFATCTVPVKAQDGMPPIPGNCAEGGRVGYSVRLLSRAQLQSDANWNIGGDGQAGAILNPLPSGSGW